MGRLHRRRLVQSAKTITSLSFDIFLPLRWTNHICKASLRDLWIPPKVHLQTPWKGRHLDLVGPMTQACLKPKKTEIQWQSKKSKYFLLFHVFKCLLYFEGLFFSPTHFIWKKNFLKFTSLVQGCLFFQLWRFYVWWFNRTLSIYILCEYKK